MIFATPPAPADESRCHNLCCTALPTGLVSDARTAGVSWSTILHLLVEYGPRAAALLKSLIDSFREESGPSA